MSKAKQETYVNGNNGAAYTAKFVKEPIDSTVKTFKMSRNDMPKGKSVAQPKGLSFKKSHQRDATLEAQLGKDERKYKLEQAIISGQVATIEDASTYLNVTVSTVRRYLKELDRTLASRGY